ncbi:MAG TPA: S8 family serine peptidase [Chitinophagaceae bacterium]|nr:S8 family serine peptidase [Chitinophagaceae bacterium]
MKRLIIVLLGSCFFFSETHAQFTRYIIQFKNKGTNPFSISNPSSYLSARAITRRTKSGISIDSTDLPITPRYIDSIKSVANVTVLNKSKWMNQVVILTTDPTALARINSFSFVQSTNPIAAKMAQGNTGNVEKLINETSDTVIYSGNARTSNLNLNYGQTFGQVNFHNGQFLHDLGFQGQEMIISVFDGGFASYKTNPAFDSIRLNGQVLGEWNFVTNIQNTDASSGHGMNCLSIMAANRPGIMVGTSPKSKYWLFITEDVFSEYPIEEVNWAAAAEFADSAGTDVISSSLGYQDFDNSQFDYLYASRNGNTSIVTRAADLAAKKGILVMNSAGNYGTLTDQRKYVSCPADGDSVMAVGATNISGTIAGFSSWGPNAAGKIKPNIVSVGQGAVVANSSGNPFASNGTSFSSPNITGLITCLWGAFPEFSNMKIFDAVQKSAHKYNNPDDRFGYGIPNMRTAYYLLKADRSRQLFGGNGWFKATPDPFTTQIDAVFIAGNSGAVKLYLKNISGNKIDSAGFVADSLDFKTHRFSNLGSLPAGYYTVQYKSDTKDSSITLTKGADLFAADWIKVFPNPFSTQVNLYFKAQVTGKAVLSLYDTKGRLMSARQSITIQKGNIYYADFSVAKKLSRGLYTLGFTDGTNKRSVKLFKN